MITIVGMTGCGPCAAAKKWFDEEGIEYKYFDVRSTDREEALEGKRRLTEAGLKTVPVIFTASANMIGFNEETKEVIRRYVARKSN